MKFILLLSLFLTLVGCNSKSTIDESFLGGIAISPSKSAVVASDASLLSGTAITLTLALRDQHGQVFWYPGSNPTVTFSTSGGTSTGIFSDVLSNDDGTFTTTFAGVNSGTPTHIIATVDGVALTSTAPAVQVLPGNYSLVHSYLSLSANTVTSGSSVTATFHTFDTSGNPLTSGGFVVSLSQNGGTSTGTFSAVTDNGDGTYTATFTGTIMGTATSIRAAIAGQVVTSVHPTVTVTHGPASQLVYATQPSGNVAVGDMLPSQPIVHIKDAAGNLITTGPDATADITLALSGGTGSLTGTTTVAAVAGVATFTNIAVNTKGSGKIIRASKEDTLSANGTGTITEDANSFTIHPSAPSAFTIASAVAGASSVVLTWNSSTDVDAYTVKYGTVSGTHGTTVSTNATSPLTISSLTPGTTYYFMVEATNITATTNATAQASATPLAAFSISSVTVDSANKLKVAFGVSAGASSYTVKYGTSTGTLSTTASTSATSPYEITGLTGGTTYYVMVTAVNSSGSVNANAEAPGIPISSFSSTSLTSGLGTLSLAFNAATGATSYDAIYDTSSKLATEAYASSVTGVTSPATLTLAAGSTYYVRARANNAYGSVVSTNELSAAPYQNFTLSIPFTSGTAGSYVLSSGTNVEVSSAGYARLKPASQTDNSTSGFDAAFYSGTQWDSTLNVVRLNTTTNTASLDATWTPQIDSLIGYWQLNGTAGNALTHTQNVAATVGGVNLQAGNSNTNMSYVAGQLSTGISFDGTDDFLYGGNSYDIGTSSATVSLWVKTSTKTDSRLIGKSSSGTNDGWFIGTEASGNLTIGLDSLTPASIQGTYADGKWHHVVVRYSRATVASLFVDGKIFQTTLNISSKSATNVLSAGNFVIGSRNTTDYFFNGNIDEVAIWGTALSDEEIIHIYQRQSAKYSGIIYSRIMDSQETGSTLNNWTNISFSTPLPFGKPIVAGAESTSAYSSFSGSGLNQNLVGLWHFDETSYNGTAGEIVDSSGNGNHGARTNTANITKNGRLGNAIVFGPDNDSAVFPVGNTFISVANQPLTISTWIYPTLINTGFSSTYRIMCIHNAAGSSSIAFGVGNTDKLMFFNGATATWKSSQTSIPLYAWTHAALTYDGSCFQLYINGVADASGCYTAGLQAGSGAVNMRVGSYMSISTSFKGSIDEVGVWKRALSSTEMNQLYRRAANRIKYQVRTCANNNCSDQVSTTQGWKGPDNTPQTYFSEYYNTTNNTGNGTILTGPSTMTFSNFAGLTVPNNRYFQYRTILESDDPSTSCTYGGVSAYCSPEIKTVTVGPNHFPASGEITTSAAAVTSSYLFINASGFSATLGTNGCSNGVRYSISPDGTSYYYWDGSTWSASTNYNTSNDSATLAANINSFPSVIGTGILKIKTYMTSTGHSACEVDSISVTGQKY
ncbi:LamG-like jellyroll fold domain-containing protein [Bdellovibrio bacteriovorus]